LARAERIPVEMRAEGIGRGAEGSKGWRGVKTKEMLRDAHVLAEE
jgi:hypothetical protein